MNKLALNNPAPASEGAAAAELEPTVVVAPSLTQADLLLEIDIETLALGPRPVITQIAVVAYELELDEYLHDFYNQYLPVEPQQQILPPRKIQASTIGWWMKQSDEAREKFELSTGTDFEDLVAAMRGLVGYFNRVTHHGQRNYELNAKGPQFDVVAVETLMLELGIEPPWSYDRVTDLRTDLRRAGISGKDVPQPRGTIPHTAYWDARWQVEQYLECRRIRVGGRV